MSCACGVQCERPCNAEPGSVCDDCQCRGDAEHRAELDALRKSYEDANARGGEANERLQRQLREAVDANVMSAALIERLRGERAEATKRADALESLIDTERQVRKEVENTLVFVRRELAEARGQWICSAGHRHGPHDVCNNPFPPAPPPAESTPVHEPWCKACGGINPTECRCAAPPDDMWERPLTTRELLLDHERRLAALEANGEPGTHAVGRPGWRTPHRFVPGMWPHANECREETRSPNNESCGLPSSDSIHKGAKT